MRGRREERDSVRRALDLGPGLASGKGEGEGGTTGEGEPQTAGQFGDSLVTLGRESQSSGEAGGQVGVTGSSL